MTFDSYAFSKYKYNLQLFAKDGDGGEKTEKPTAKKIKDSRKEGQVAKSKEISVAASLLAIFISMKITIGFIGERLLKGFSRYINLSSVYVNNPFDQVASHQIIVDTLTYILITILPFLLVGLIVGFYSQKIQIKWMVTAKPLEPKFNKLNPISGFKRMFSKQSFFELFISIVKIVIITYMSISIIKDKLGLLRNLYDYNIKDCLVLLFDIIMELGFKISIAYFLLAVLDYYFQKWKHNEDLKMTKQEIKEEFKQQEGDPKVKSKQRQRMHLASRRRMMQSIPEADVVITNPTHFAVALKYDTSAYTAPFVVAKGADYLAFKIKEIAKDNLIEIIENKPLARMLYDTVEVGDEIPPELYKAVAEILATLSQIRDKMA